VLVTNTITVKNAGGTTTYGTMTAYVRYYDSAVCGSAVIVGTPPSAINMDVSRTDLTKTLSMGYTGVTTNCGTAAYLILKSSSPAKYDNAFKTNWAAIDATGNIAAASSVVIPKSKYDIDSFYEFPRTLTLTFRMTAPDGNAPSNSGAAADFVVTLKFYDPDCATDSIITAAANVE
jgi:hypothetical protein